MYPVRCPLTDRHSSSGKTDQTWAIRDNLISNCQPDLWHAKEFKSALAGLLNRDNRTNQGPSTSDIKYDKSGDAPPEYS
jgi:hypothetical protein